MRSSLATIDEMTKRKRRDRMLSKETVHLAFEQLTRNRGAPHPEPPVPPPAPRPASPPPPERPASPGPSGAPRPASPAPSGAPRPASPPPARPSGSRWDEIKRILTLDPLDYYGILGVSKSSASAGINRSHIKMVRNIHPDRMGEHGKHPDVLEAIQRVNNAADVLKDPETRNIFDTATSAAHFVQGMQQHSAKQASARQDKEAEESRARAQAAAEQHARERTADRRASGPWYRDYHGKTVTRIANRILEYKAYPGTDGNSFTRQSYANERQDERKIRQAKERQARYDAGRFRTPMEES